MYQNFIIPYLYEAQHVSGDTAHHQEPKTALAATGRVSLLHNLFITEIYEKIYETEIYEIYEKKGAFTSNIQSFDIGPNGYSVIY